MQTVNTSLFLDRFLSYVRIDTQSVEGSNTFPSTAKQLNLGKKLVKELIRLGLQEIEMTKHGYVFGTLPSNVDDDVPIIGLIAHIDTSPDVSGRNVNPIVHRNYQGEPILFENGDLIDLDSEPELKNYIGHDIITSDGTTLLGADDKAGIAEIMAAIEYLVKNPDIKHGTIRIAFTVDEEIGNGTKYFDLEKFGAAYAYTLDGGKPGEIEHETFCADTAIISVKGNNVHPGYAKNRMINALKIAAEFIDKLPKDTMSPETTEGREGYLHPLEIKGNVELVRITFLVRDFLSDGLKEKEKKLDDICKDLMGKYPGVSIDMELKESYRNMRYKLDEYPEVLEYAMEAVRRTGLRPKLHFVRGGTDGARLAYMGLPTPNLFSGGQNSHSRKEWISVQDMEKAVTTIINLVQIWAEKSKNDDTV